MTARRSTGPRTDPDSRDIAPNFAPPPDALPGVVVRAYGKFFTVALADGQELLSTVKGVLKRHRRGTDLVAVGDRVFVRDVGGGEGARVLGSMRLSPGTYEALMVVNPYRSGTESPTATR